ncbi:MAG: response regulator [Candidatus Omnitrophota bacterium]
MTDAKLKKKVLVVDDDLAVLTLLGKTLENIGFEVFKGSNGQEALAFVRKNKPDLIILDQMMPIMDGIKVCALLKADRRFREIPIIMFTASADETDRKLSQEMGANAFCNKPLNVSDLVQKIQELIKQR